MPSLFDPYNLGPIRLANRIVMAPMTRSRARNAALAPDADTALYYAQRAGAGLIITGGVPISVEGQGWAFAPGIYTPEQIAGWRDVTDAVHAKGGVIFAQLWHNGRASHVSHQKDRRAPVSSVDTQARGVVSFAFDDSGEPAYLPQSKPRALEIDEISRVTDDFVQAARNAMAAGFDGIELHAANGYIFDQFINGALNTRDDRYGGAPIENRLRLTLETVDAVTAAIGGERTGIRLSPFGRYNDMRPYAGEEETGLALAAELSTRRLAYVHITDEATLGEPAIPEGFLAKFRRAYSGTLIVAGGYTKDNGQATLDADGADLIAFGRPFISNPDLVERLRNGWPLTAPDRATFSTMGGATDMSTIRALRRLGSQVELRTAPAPPLPPERGPTSRVSRPRRTSKSSPTKAFPRPNTVFSCARRRSMLLRNKQPRSAVKVWEDSMANTTGVTESATELHGTAKGAFDVASEAMLHSFASNKRAARFIDQYSQLT